MQRPAKPCTPVRSRPPPPHSDFPRRVAQLVRALPSHGRGHWFESTRAYQDTGSSSCPDKPTGMVGFFYCPVIRRLLSHPGMFVVCVFPHIQMLSKSLLFVLKPVKKNVSILNRALSMAIAGVGGVGHAGRRFKYNIADNLGRTRPI